MIDNIKIINSNFNCKHILNTLKWTIIHSESENIDSISKIMQKAKLYNDYKNNKKIMGLRLLITENIKCNTFSISIQGSIRKWYFKSNSRKDLNYIEFLHCIELLEEKLGISKGEIWSDFKITNLEVGVTLLLKSKFRNIMDCFVKYRNSVRIDTYETSLYFKFKNYDILFYDKLKEISKGKIPNENEKNIIDKFYFLRFEVSVTKVSGSTFRKEFNSLELLKTNWNKLPNRLFRYMNEIDFIDVISEEKYLMIKSKSDFLNNLCYQGIKSIGIQRTIMDFAKLEIPNNKTKYFRDLMDIYKSNKSKKNDYKSELLEELKKKTDRLYNKGNIKYIQIA